MSNWDVAKPLDTDIVSQFPANERAARTALVSNFSVNHWGTNDANVGKHSTINLLDQGADPALVAGQGNIYSKSISSASELFWRSTAGAALQLTSGAGINPAVLTSVPAGSLTGTVIDARLSGNVPLLNVSNTFSVFQSIIVTGADWLPLDSSNANGSFIRFKQAGASIGFLGNSKNVSGGTLNDIELFSSAGLLLTGATVKINGVLATDFARLSLDNTFSKAGGNTQTLTSTSANRAVIQFQTNSVTRGLFGADGAASDIIVGSVLGDLSMRAVSGNINLSLDNGGTIHHKFTALNSTTTLNGVTVSDFARLSQSNIFTGATQTINAASALLKVTDGTREVRLNSEATKGSVGTFSNHDFALFTNNSTRLVLDAAGTLAGSTIIGVAFSDFARLSQANNFTAIQTITLAGTAALAINNSLNNANDQAFVQFRTNTTTRGYVGVGNIANGLTRDDVSLVAVAGGLGFSGDNGATAHFKLSSTGLVTTLNASASEVGYKGLPQNSQSVSYTTVLADCNKNLHQTGATKTFTIDSNANVAAPIGTVLNFTCDNATGVSIAITTDTLRLAGTATTGTRTLAQYGVATAIKILATTWLISGAGLS